MFRFHSRLLITFLLLVRWLPAQPGEDLRLTYRSSIDDTDQRYRVYVPSSYRPGQPIPVALVLHGTNHNENTFFEDERRYPPRNGVKNAAEKFGVLAVVPFGRGNTEFKGIGETDVFCVLADVKRRFTVDEDRVYLTGHSMGGHGSAYLGFHHPDQFAAVAPLAAAYGFSWLAASARHLPFLWIGGEKDEEYYRVGVAAAVDRMKRLGYPVQFIELPGEDHFGPVKDFVRVFEWLVQQRRVAHPRSFTFEVDTPLHPRAYWTTVESIAEPGRVATVRARVDTDNRAWLELENVAAISVWPDPQIFSLGRPLEVYIADRRVYSGHLPASHEVFLTRNATGWTAVQRPRRELSLTDYRTNPVAFAPESLDMDGTEARLANWITDAMRSATGADVAFYCRAAYRGLPIPAGAVDVVDVIQCTRPFDQYLVTAELKGREIVEILDDNIQDVVAQKRRNLLVQISGGKYSFNRQLAPGKRIVSSTFEPDRTYKVVMEGQVVERDTTIRLAGRFKKLPHQLSNIPLSLALYRYSALSKELVAQREGRIQEIDQPLADQGDCTEIAAR